jgi:hypothetical protein
MLELFYSLYNVKISRYFIEALQVTSFQISFGMHMKITYEN